MLSSVCRQNEAEQNINFNRTLKKEKKKASKVNTTKISQLHESRVVYNRLNSYSSKDIKSEKKNKKKKQVTYCTSLFRLYSSLFMQSWSDIT